MKLGILDAVPPEFYLPEEASDGQKFIDLLSEAGFEGEMAVYPVGEGQFPASLDEQDAYLVTGSPASVYDDRPWIAELLDFIRAGHSQQKPMVGICFGHQAIAQALGGQVEAVGWHIGLKTFQVLDPPAWMNPAVESCQIYHINQDQVTALPPEAIHLGQSQACPNSMFSLGSHIFCMQGHPEQGLSSMRNFIRELREVVPPAIQTDAESSFRQGEPHRQIAAQWIRSFLESRSI